LKPYTYILGGGIKKAEYNEIGIGRKYIFRKITSYVKIFYSIFYSFFGRSFTEIFMKAFPGVFPEAFYEGF